MARYTAYTDGSCLGNPGPGGWAAVVFNEAEDRYREFIGGEAETTNNRMELAAAVAALKAGTSPGDTVRLVTDSQYLRKAFDDYWLAKWKHNGWVTAAGRPVKNRDLWTALDALVAERDVDFKWVKGHAGHSLNERCDRLARAAAVKTAGRSTGRRR